MAIVLVANLSLTLHDLAVLSGRSGLFAIASGGHAQQGARDLAQVGSGHRIGRRAKDGRNNDLLASGTLGLGYAGHHVGGKALMEGHGIARDHPLLERTRNHLAKGGADGMLHQGGNAHLGHVGVSGLRGHLATTSVFAQVDRALARGAHGQESGGQVNGALLDSGGLDLHLLRLLAQGDGLHLASYGLDLDLDVANVDLLGLVDEGPALLRGALGTDGIGLYLLDHDLGALGQDRTRVGHQLHGNGHLLHGRRLVEGTREVGLGGLHLTNCGHVTLIGPGDVRIANGADQSVYPGLDLGQALRHRTVLGIALNDLHHLGTGDLHLHDHHHLDLHLLLETAANGRRQ